MKNKRLFALGFWLFSTAFLLAADPLARRISVNFRAVPIRNALDEVAEKGQFEWSYNPKILAEKGQVSLRAVDWTVREVLHELLGDDFEVKTSGHFVILKRQKAPRSAISGTLRDPKTGERLAGATVFDRRTLRATTTDSSGFYRLKIKGRADIAVAKIGYRDTFFSVESTAARFRKLDLLAVDSSLFRPDPPRSRATQLEYFFAATLDEILAVNVPDTFRRHVQLSLLPKIGTNRRFDAKVKNAVSINLIAGHSGGVGGFEAAGVGNFTRKNVAGVQLAGAFNFARGGVRGAQMAGAVNVLRDTLAGFQAAGAINFAKKSSGFSAQIAGAVNVADEIDGLQIAGAVNHARKMRGLQIGLFNSAAELDGLQIGLLNRSGRRWLPILNW